MLKYSYHIHINGLVQGVGFRPFVCRLAKQWDIAGWVSNTNDGVHIEYSATEENATEFYTAILKDPPLHSIITHHHQETIAFQSFSDFSIRQSNNDAAPNLLLTPDIAICECCKEEIKQHPNKRFHYPFTTCLQCGPRYSIINRLPYDREHTTMAHLKMCVPCQIEYNDINNRRHYSQTNSCPDCAIPIHFYSSPVSCLSDSTEDILAFCLAEFKRGSIIAVKGVGGYLLMCDATNLISINNLRARKQRPAKPFAVLYADVTMAEKDVYLRPIEIETLNDQSGPIVLCKIKENAVNAGCTEAIAPGLDKLGLMFPCSPLLYLIATAFDKPLIATSANISGSPIIYKDKEALERLFEMADYILTYEREIVAPQDDSVIQFSENGQRIILRRSRGLAPNYFPNPLPPTAVPLLAMGAELKSAFALQHQQHLYISQFLGNQVGLESQISYAATLDHLLQLLKSVPKKILIDAHPGYAVAAYGRELAEAWHISFTAIQHHKAHFGAVLAENNLLLSNQRVLGVIWDGTGYGDDGQIWGGEFFVYENKNIKRVAFLDYFPQLLGDKMSKEPRLSALCLLKDFPDKQFIIQKYFTTTSWQYYQQLLQQPVSLNTSSMGRFLDGIAAILGIRLFNSYEGEAAMQLEVIARNCKHKTTAYYEMDLVNDRLNWKPFMVALLDDFLQHLPVSEIAWKVFLSLAKAVEQLATHFKVNKLAFSGGVFQNALLNDILIDLFSEKTTLYFHQQLSPNDECIGLGQLACYGLSEKAIMKNNFKEDNTEKPTFEITTK